MVSNYEKPPVFSRDRTWKEGDLKHVDKVKIAGHHAKEEVYIYGGEKGIEFLVSKTLADYVAATERLSWTWQDAYDNFYRVLEGSPRTTWEEVIAERPALRALGEPGFNVATELLIKKLLNNNSPRDQQWIYMAPGGDRSFLRDIMTRPADHLRRFNEIIRISKLLPQGNIADPSAALQVQWLYMSYHRIDRSKYVESGKVLENETLETLTAYFQAIHDQRVLDGTLKQQLKQPAKASDERRDRHKDRGSDNRRPTSRRPDYQRDRHHDRDRDRGRGRDRHRDHRNRRDYDSHRSRDKVKDRSRSSSTKPKPIADPCPKHSSDGNPARHTWAECSLNPANSKASSSSRDRCGHDSHHSETRSPSPSRLRSPSPYSDDDRGRSSSPSDRSYASGTSNEDNYATFEEVMKPPTRKRSGRELSKANRAEPPGKRKRNRMKSVEDRIPKKRTATLESESSEEDGEANVAEVRDENNPLDM